MDAQPLATDAADAPLGQPLLALLSRRWVPATLGELARGPRRAPELERRLRRLSHEGLMHTLAQLARHDAVRRGGRGGVGDGAHHVLTARGYALLAIHERAAALDHTGGRPRGGSLLRAMADAGSRALLVELAGGPPDADAVRERADAADATALRGRIAALRAAGLLASGDPNLRAHHAPSPVARTSATVAILAMDAERARLDAETPPSDLLAMLALLAPTVPLASAAHGGCRLYVSPGRERHACLSLRAADGRLHVPGELRASECVAYAYGPVGVWLDALREGAGAPLGRGGEERLIGHVLEAYAQALAPRPLALA